MREIDESEKLLHVQHEAAYYKKLAQDCGERRLKETEELSCMIAKLRQTEKELAQARNELEQRVHERTLELKETNRSLKNEIIERKRTEEHLLQARKEAEAANRAKSIFLANMSHELRTPLNAILGFAQLMERDQDVAPQHHDYVRIITRSGEHLLAVINDILEMSKIEAGLITLHQQRVDVSTLLRDLHDMFTLRAQNKNLLLHIEIDSDVPQFILADNHKLKQILINLLTNAIKFTPHGQITLHVSSPPLSCPLPGFIPPQTYMSEIVCTSSEPSIPNNPTHKIRFAVTDTGMGIPHDQIPLLFQAFTQTTNNQQVQEGTGLGLPISQHYVETMHGTLSIISEVDKGSTFAFDIPFSETDPPTIAQRGTDRRILTLAPGQPDYRILVIEDIQSNRELITRLLESVHFQVRTASNGQEGVDIWNDWQPHLIFMDIRMPGMNGYEATRAIKSTPRGQATTIIALTASAFEDERANVLDAGCDDFIRKPFRDTDIFESIRKHINVTYLYNEYPTSGNGIEPSTIAKATHHHAEQDTSICLTTNSLHILPADTIKQLHDTALLCDIDAIMVLVDEISHDHPAIGEALHKLVNSFEFDNIISLTTPMIAHQ